MMNFQDLNTMSAQLFDDEESVSNFITFVYYWLTYPHTLQGYGLHAVCAR